MNVSRETIARRLATRAATIDDFEAGAVTALPHWKETERIVRGYCELLRLDPRAHSLAHPQPSGLAGQPAADAGSAGLPLRRPPAVRPNGMPATVVRTSERAKDRATRTTGRRQPASAPHAHAVHPDGAGRARWRASSIPPTRRPGSYTR